MTSRCKRPRKPQRKPNPRAAEESFSKVSAGSFSASLSSAFGQVCVVVRRHRIDRRENDGFRFLVARQRILSRVGDVGDRISNGDVADGLDIGDHIAHRARCELVRLDPFELQQADFFDVVLLSRVHQADGLFWCERAFLDAAQHDDAAISIILSVEDQRLRRVFRVPRGCWELLHDGFEKLVYPLP